MLALCLLHRQIVVKVVLAVKVGHGVEGAVESQRSEGRRLHASLVQDLATEEKRKGAESW